MLAFTTRCPGRTCSTPGPTSTTSPANSWPRTVPASKPGVSPWKGKRSAPQIAVARTATIASPGSRTAGSATSSTATSPGARRTTAFTQAARSRRGSRPGRRRRSGSRPTAARASPRGSAPPLPPAAGGPPVRRRSRPRAPRLPAQGPRAPSRPRPAGPLRRALARRVTASPPRALASHRADRRRAPRPRTRSGHGRTRPSDRRRPRRGSLRHAVPSVVRVAAVGDEELARDPPGFLRREEGDRWGDVGGDGAPRDRLQHLDEVERLGVLAREHALRLRQPRRDRVDGDPMRAELARERARERPHTAFRSDVVREVRRAGEDHVRGDVDDAPVGGLAHRLLRVVAG